MIKRRTCQSRKMSNTCCTLESLEGRVCMSASITIDQTEGFSANEHDTIGFANKVGGPVFATLHWVGFAQDPSQLQVSLSWSDGTVTKGGIASYQDEGDLTPVYYATLGDTKYMGDPGSKSVDVFINEVGHPDVNASTKVNYTVDEYPLFGHSKQATANAAPHELRNVTVATFEDGFVLNSNPPATDVLGSASNFTATIDWGDGSVTNGAILATLTKGLYSVVGSHTYGGLAGKTYPVSVHVVEKATGNQVTVNSTATVYQEPIIKPINVVTAPLNPFSTTQVTKVWDL